MIETVMATLICDKCKVSVASCEVRKDWERQGFIFSAKCHGEEDECFISKEFIEEFSNGKILALIAFARGQAKGSLVHERNR